MGDLNEKNNQHEEKETELPQESIRENPYAHMGILGDLLWGWDQWFEERKKRKRERWQGKNDL